MSAPAPASLFEPAAPGTWAPTELARGPWSPDALHGGPVAALVTRAAEAAGGEGALPLSRLTLELLRPVPLRPLAVAATVVRPGRKVELVDVAVTADGVEVAWARALRLRALPGHDPAASASPAPAGAAPTGPPGHGRPLGGLPDDQLAFHTAGATLALTDGGPGSGAATVWVRLLVPVVPGEAPSGAQRAAAAADFGNGVSSALPFTEWMFINPDLTVLLERPPVGEWVALQATTVLGRRGVGVARSVLWDATGRVGTAAQTLVVEPRR